MRPALGMSVGSAELRAVLTRKRRVVWAASIPYADANDAAAAIGRLASDLPVARPRVRVVLSRDVVQLRTLASAPPLSATAARRYVALEAGRLFRKDGASLVTDGRAVWVGPRDRALLAAGAPEPLVRAVVQGCEEAGLTLEALGPAADVLPWALADPPARGDVTIPLADGHETLSLSPAGVWRSRRRRDADSAPPRWCAALSAAGQPAAALAEAYAAAIRRPVLDLLPRETRAARVHVAWRRVRVTLMGGAALWVAAGVVRVARLQALGRETERQLLSMDRAVDSALTLHGDLNAARAAVATIRRAERGRSRTLSILGDLTTSLGDSVVIAALELTADTSFRLVGDAPQAARVLVNLERMPWLRGARFESPVLKEQIAPGDELDRFSILARTGQWP